MVEGVEVLSEVIEYGSTFVYLNEDPLKENTLEHSYNFLGWYYDETGNVKYQTSDVVQGETTLYAISLICVCVISPFTLEPMLVI